MDVEGMTCGACSARVERTLNRMDGVTGTVNFATGRAVATVTPTETPSGEDDFGHRIVDMIEAITKAGYSARVAGAPVEDGQPQTAHVPARRRLWWRLGVTILFGVPLADLSIANALSPQSRYDGWEWVLIALALPIATWCAWPFHRAAWLAARQRTTTMDTLISLGILASCVLSVYTIFFAATEPSDSIGGWHLLFQAHGAIYLDVIPGVTAFVLIGRILESLAKSHAGNALRALASAGARDAALLMPDGREHRIPADQLRVGDRFVVRPGEVIPTDGTVHEGHAAVDVSTMTGESVPVEVGAGATVVGGTVALDGRLVVDAEKVGRETQIAQLVEMVERAQSEKAAAQRLADRISGFFVPLVLALAVATAAVWAAVGENLSSGFSPALAVIVVACPCALGLATPMALMVAADRAAREGVFIKSQHALEVARGIDTVVLDKTGTVTEGRMSVVASWPAAPDADVLRRAGAIEDASTHPVADAVSGYVQPGHGAFVAVENYRSLAGLGAEGQVEGHTVLVGSLRLMRERAIVPPADLQAWLAEQQKDARGTVVVAQDGQAVLALAVSDTVKPSAAAAIEQIHRLGLRTVLLTGDNRITAEAVAQTLGINEVVAEVLPAQKADVIAGLRAEGRSVAMVGDGVNDAPALAQADLGLALMSGTDVARAAADLLLLRGDLRVVPDAIELARATVSTMRWNLAWAFGYNVAAIPLAAAGLLNPIIAAAAMAFSSLFVVTNSLRLGKGSSARQR
nr:heavy metal translocating P-type ATPase [Kineosporia babensis]